MDKRNKNHFMRPLKMFCISFIVISLACVVTFKLLYPNQKVDLNYLLATAAILSLSLGISHFKSYKKYNTKIMCEALPSNDIVVNMVKLEGIMKHLHWSVQDKTSDQIVFKSSIIRTFLTEYLIINIGKDGLEFIGPHCYVEEVVKRLQT